MSNDNSGNQPDYGQPNYGQPGYGQQPTSPYGQGGVPAGGQPGQPVDTTQPASIKLAVTLMRVGALLSLISLVSVFFLMDQIRDEAEKSLATSGTEITDGALDAAVAIGVGFTVFLGLIGVALWLWMASANGKGRSWARVVATVLYGLYVLSFLASLAQSQPLISTLLSLVSLVLGGVIIFLLWKKESTAFYQANTAPKFAS